MIEKAVQTIVSSNILKAIARLDFHEAKDFSFTWLFIFQRTVSAAISPTRIHTNTFVQQFNYLLPLGSI